MDCPESVESYIHRAGRTARYQTSGRSILFLMPSEMQMLSRLQSKKIPIHFIKANAQKMQAISGSLAALLVKFPEIQYLAQRAFINYLKSIHKQHDKEIFDLTKLPLDEFAASLGLPLTPRVRFLPKKGKGKNSSPEKSLCEIQSFVREKAKGKNPSQDNCLPQIENSAKENLLEISRGKDMDEELLLKKDNPDVLEENTKGAGSVVHETRVGKKKKLKINIHRPVGTRVVFDEEGNAAPPLAKLASQVAMNDNGVIQLDKVKERYEKMREAMKPEDKEDKRLEHMRLREKRIKQKEKRKRNMKRGNTLEEEEEEVEREDVDGRATGERTSKRLKIYFDSKSDDDSPDYKDDNSRGSLLADSISLAEQEELALKLLSSMHS